MVARYYKYNFFYMVKLFLKKSSIKIVKSIQFECSCRVLKHGYFKYGYI